jgi:hypothetical protein
MSVCALFYMLLPSHMRVPYCPPHAIAVAFFLRSGFNFASRLSPRLTSFSLSLSLSLLLPACGLRAVRIPVDASELPTLQAHGLPNAQRPSDHLPLAAVFAFPDTAKTSAETSGTPPPGACTGHDDSCHGHKKARRDKIVANRRKDRE